MLYHALLRGHQITAASRFAVKPNHCRSESINIKVLNDAIKNGAPAGCHREKQPRPNGEILKNRACAPHTATCLDQRQHLLYLLYRISLGSPSTTPTLPYPTLNAPKCSLPYPPLNDTTSSCQRTPPSGRRALDTGHWTLGAGHSTIAATRLRLPHTLLGHCADLFSKVGLGFRERRHPCPDLLQQGTTLPYPTLT